MDEDAEGVHKYEFLDRANSIHILPSKEKAGYISPPMSTNPAISENVPVASSTPYLCEHTPADYIFEGK